MKAKESIIVPHGDVIIKSGEGQRVIGQGGTVPEGATIISCTDERTESLLTEVKRESDQPAKAKSKSKAKASSK